MSAHATGAAGYLARHNALDSELAQFAQRWNGEVRRREEQRQLQQAEASAVVARVNDEARRVA